MIGDLLRWITRSGSKLTDLDERMVERYLRRRSGKQSIQPGDRAALKRLLSVLRDAGTIAPAAQPPITPQDQIFAEFSDYLRRERGLAPKSIIRHLPVVRRFLREVCPAGASDLGKISQEDVTRYIERHARDWSAASGKAMCWSLRAFLRYLHHRGLTPLPLGGCVPSIRRWKFASLPTYLSAAQVQKVLDGCDRMTALGRRDYAILMMLAKLGLRADEVATLTLDDIDWRSSEMLVRAKGRQRARMPMPSDVGAAVVAYLRDGRPASSCRRLFLRMLARASRPRLPASLRHPNASRLVSRGDRCRAAAPGAFHLPRPHLRARHLLVPLGLSGVDGRGGAAPRSTVGSQAMKPSCNVATLIERYFTERLMRQRNAGANTIAS